ncbi:MAG TPA: hypothetical protein VFA15_01005 [Nitrososphaera sp.]|nr:hypothetical protein [Nitrososphaera sp.]
MTSEPKESAPSPSPESPPQILSKRDRIASIADELVSIDRKNIGATLLELLKRVASSERSSVYWTCKKYLQDDYGLLIADSGHVGISDRYLPNLMFPCDIVVYSVVDMLRSGDYIQILQLNDTKEITIEHARVETVSIVDGAVRVEDLLSGSSYSTPKNSVIGKVVKVLSAFSAEWNSVFYEFKDRAWLQKTLKKNLDLYRNASASNQRQVVSEIEKRLAKLREESR